MCCRTSDRQLTLGATIVSLRTRDHGGQRVFEPDENRAQSGAQHNGETQKKSCLQWYNRAQRAAAAAHPKRRRHSAKPSAQRAA
eukprot:4115094-Prymnesium_polylepis.1